MHHSTATAPEDRLDFKRVLPVFLIVFVDLMGLTVTIPFITYYAASFGADAVLIGLLQMAYPLMQFIGAPILGDLSQKYGRKPILIISQIGTFIGFIMLAFANSLWILFLARIIDGFTGGNISTAQAALTDITTPRTRTQAMGLIGAAFGLGFVLGPAISGIALSASNSDYRIPSLIAAGFSLLALTLTQFVFHETLPPEKRGASTDAVEQPSRLRRMIHAAQHPAVGILLILIFTQQLIFGGFERVISLFLLSRLGMSASNNAIIFLLVGIIAVLVQGVFIGSWSRRLGERKLIFAGMALLGAGLLLMAFTPAQAVNWYDRNQLITELTDPEGTASIDLTTFQLPSEDNKGWAGIGWLLVSLVPIAVGGSVLQPSINSLVTKRVDPIEVGAILGISAAFLSAANTLAPLISGVIFQFGGETAPFLLGGGSMIVLLFFALRRLVPNPRDNLAKEAMASAAP
ncbi:MAG: MFS transporter [Anaerolineaceae bacterium]|nr:MFS transporter [Anaerolineaceae bacterium]